MMLRYFTFLLACITIGVNAQTICLSGQVTNGKDYPIENGNVTLKSSDSIVMQRTVTDAKGKFKLCIGCEGKYRMYITAVGYKKYEKEIYLKQDMLLKPIVLEEQIVALEEVTVTKSKIIRKADRQIILPTQKQIESSMNGLDLFQKMNQFHIRVNIPRQEISYGSCGNVEIRINAVKSSVNEISALQPDQILKVEYYEHGNTKFKTEGAVLNFIVKHSEGGGAASVSLFNAVHTGFGNDRVSVKLNHKKSEFALSYLLSYEHYKDRWMDENITYQLESNTITQLTKGKKVPYEDINHKAYLTYNLIDSANYMLNIKAYIPTEKYNNSFANQKTFLEYPDVSIDSDSKNQQKSISPSVDLYFIKYLPKEQTFAVNVVGTYFDTDYNRMYTENRQSILISRFNEAIKGKKQSIIGEAYYEKGWGIYQFNAGAAYKYERTDNNYKELQTSDLIDNFYTYIYTNFYGTIDKIGISMELSGTYSNFNNHENNKYDFFNFTPKITLSYYPNDYLNFYLNAAIKTINPTISSLNNISQPIDYFTIQQGNPELKPYKYYRTSLSSKWRKNNFSVTGNIAYDHSHKPIMNSTFLENNKIVYQQQNQKFIRHANAWLDFRLDLFDESLSLYWSSSVDYYYMGGNTFRHKGTYFSTGCDIDYYYKNWTFSLTAYMREKSLYGEFISKGMFDQRISAGYKLNNFYLGAGLLTPFMSKWSAGGDYLSSIAGGRSWTYMGAASPMFYLNFSWNITWGRKYKSERKTLNNSDSDNGVLHIKDK